MVIVILAVLHSGCGYISSATYWLWLYYSYYMVVVVLAVLHTGYGYISSVA
jgi:hypothetical protein